MIHSSKRMVRRAVAVSAAIFALTVPASAGSQEPARKASHFLPMAEEPPAKIQVEAPLPGPLAARGTAVIPYRLENFRILPIFGTAATEVSPRAGHLHVTVDQLSWHWADAGNTDAVVVAGLSPGPHSVLVELSTPDHRILAGQRVHFTIPAVAAGHAAGSR